MGSKWKIVIRLIKAIMFNDRPECLPKVDGQSERLIVPPQNGNADSQSKIILYFEFVKCIKHMTAVRFKLIVVVQTIELDFYA